ncbi:MAG: accessory factor UbiK family protein [Thiotrichales bacterium]|nr:accessory factor UbiK family protein [Thiotrichales bacterium]
MFNPVHLEEFVKKVTDAIPPGLGELPESAKHQLQLNLQRWFEKMDLVSREEFDTQKAVLAKTRAKLEMLEQRLAQLEQEADPASIGTEKGE